MRLTKLFAIPSCFLAAIFCGNTLVLAEEEEAEKITVVGTRSHERSAADLAVPVDTLDSTALLRQGSSRMEDMLSRIAPSFTVALEPIGDAATLVRPANMRGLPPDSTLVLVNGKRRHRSSVITFLGNGLNDGAHGADLSAIPAIALDRVEVLRDNAGAQYGSDAVAGIINFVLKEDSEGGSMDVRWGQYYYGDGENITIAGNVGLPLTENGFLNLSAEYNEADPTSRSSQSDRSNYLINAGNPHVRTPAAMVWGAPDIKDNYKLFANAAIGLGDLHEAYAFGNYAERTVEGGFYYRSPRRRTGIFAGARDKTRSDIRDEQQLSLVIDQMPWLAADSGCVPPSVEDSAQGSGETLTALEESKRCYAFNLRFPAGFTPQFGGDVEDTSIAFGLRGELAEDFTYDFSGVYGRHEVDHFIKNTINPQLAAQENNIPTSYNPGGYVETDYTFNLDFTTQVDVDAFYSPLHVGFGVEYREEEFETKRGDLNSWFIDYYKVAQDLNGDGDMDDPGEAASEFEEPANLASMTCEEYQAYSARTDLRAKYSVLGVGSNGFTGFPPCAEGKEDRSSVGAYIDFESDVTENLLLGLAVRHEDPEEFDSTLDGKFSARLQATEDLALRGSVGTGFRVPTVGQANVQNVTTGISDGQLIDQLTLPPTHVLLQGVAESLDAEESTSFGLGAVINVGGFDLTIDYYHIEVDDRIGSTSKEPIDCLLMRRVGATGDCLRIIDVSDVEVDFSVSAMGADRDFKHILTMTGDGENTGTVKEITDPGETKPVEKIFVEMGSAVQDLLEKALEAREDLRSAVPAIDAIGEAKYFANDFDTTTEGIDVVATYPMEFLDGLTTLTLAANWNRTKVDEFNPRTIDAKKKHIIEEGRPKVRFTMTADHESGPWQILGRIRYYGSHVDYAGAGLDNDMMIAEARTLVDFEAAYNFTDNLAVAFGAENLFDNDPTRHKYQGFYGNLYPESTPFDFNGGFYYAKAMLNF